MTDITKLTTGSVDDLKNALASLSHDDLLRLKAAEEAGQKRSTAIKAIDAAIAAADATRAGGRVTAEPRDEALHPAAIAADLNPSEPAGIAPAKTIDTSGAPQQIVPGVDMAHPAVDADPRANTTELQNRIDFNDPARNGREVVEEALAKSAEG